MPGTSQIRTLGYVLTVPLSCLCVWGVYRLLHNGERSVIVKHGQLPDANAATHMLRSGSRGQLPEAPRAPGQPASEPGPGALSQAPSPTGQLPGVSTAMQAPGSEASQTPSQASPVGGEAGQPPLTKRKVLVVVNDYNVPLLEVATSPIMNETGFLSELEIVALDDVSFAKCPTLWPPPVTCSRMNRTLNASRFGKDDFYPIGWTKMDVVMTALRTGKYEEVLVLDADVLLLKPVERLHNDTDFEFQAENKAGGGLNNGVMMFRNSSAAVTIIKRMMAMRGPEDHTHDQNAMNAAAKKSPDVPKRALPVDKYGSKCWGYPKPGARTWHANCCGGVDKKLSEMTRARDGLLRPKKKR